MKHAFLGVFSSFCTIAILSAQPAKIQPAATADNAAPKTAVVEDKGVEKVLAGTIVSVDPAKKSITIKVKSGDYSVSITPTTAITAKNTALTSANLKPGDYVSVNYRKFNTGERRAERIDNRTYISKTSAQEPQNQTRNNPAQKTEIKTQPATQPAAQTQPAVQKEAKTQPATQHKPVENTNQTEAAK